MRQHLSITFPRIDVVDLTWKFRKKERSPDGFSVDENVFDIQQGVSYWHISQTNGYAA